MQKLSQKDILRESLAGKVRFAAQAISKTARDDAKKATDQVATAMGHSVKGKKAKKSKVIKKHKPDDDAGVEAIIQYWKKSGDKVKIIKVHEPSETKTRKIDFKINGNRNGQALLRPDDTIADIKPRT